PLGQVQGARPRKAGGPPLAGERVRPARQGILRLGRVPRPEAVHGGGDQPERVRVLGGLPALRRGYTPIGGGAELADRPRRPPFPLPPLTPPEIAVEVRERFGRFIAERVNPGARDRDRTATPLSRELLREAGDVGLMGFTLPVEMGGGGRRWREWGLVLH